MKKLVKKELQSIRGGEGCPFSMVANCLVGLDASQSGQHCWDDWRNCLNGGLPQPVQVSY